MVTDDLNQILYDYTVEVRNRFKGLDLIDRVPDELWNEVHDIVQCRGPAPADPGYSKERRHRRGSGYDSFN